MIAKFLIASALSIGLSVPGMAAVTSKIPLPKPRPDTATGAAELAMPARTLFGARKEPSAGPPHAIGTYANGCQAGALALPITGKTWQVMRLSRNRNWGQPSLVTFIERLAAKAPSTGWSGLLIGDMAQPRGGPMVSGHASHQIGLDVDIWFLPMPDHELTPTEREDMSAPDLVLSSGRAVDPKQWTPAHAAIVKATAEDPAVERIFVNAAIKKQLCESAGSDRAWLHKVRAWYQHRDHFHVRLRCPANSPECKKQEPIPDGDGCGKALDFWFRDNILHPTPGPPRPGRPMTLAKLPAACRQVLHAPGPALSSAR